MSADRVSRGLAWRAALLLTGIGLLLLGGGFVTFVQTMDVSETPPSHHSDGMVALTGGADRVSDAIELLAAGHADRLLITGVNPMTSRDGLARYLPRSRRLIKCCVDLGYQALDTIGNARETAAWVRANNLRSLIVVTSNYHMPRALAEIGSVLPGIDLQAYAVVSDAARTTSWWSDPHRTRLLAWEYLKYVAALARLRLMPTETPGSATQVATQAG